jgi:TatD-related deoxyribonuclease
LSGGGRKAPFPIFDAHLHLDPEGRGTEAVKEFKRAGGSGLVVVHKPYHAIPCTKKEDFIRSFEVTISLAEKARAETGLVVLVALSPHPAELPELASGQGLEKAKQVMLGALDAAANLVKEGRAHALGEIGRPHYPVGPELWAASNELLVAGLEHARELGCAAVLHTESATPEVFKELAAMARSVGIQLDRVVKHYSPPIIKLEDNHGLFPSVLAGKDALEKALAQGTRFLLETDYLDDSRRPGAVLGPATVPRRTLELFENGHLTEEQGFMIHRDNPRKVFGADLK